MSHHDSADLYGIDDWGNGYFRISKKGEVTVRLNDEDGGKKDVSLCDLLEGLKERGTRSEEHTSELQSHA